MPAASSYASGTFPILSALSMAAHFLLFISYGLLHHLLFCNLYIAAHFVCPFPLWMWIRSSQSVSHVCCTFFFFHSLIYEYTRLCVSRRASVIRQRHAFARMDSHEQRPPRRQRAGRKVVSKRRLCSSTWGHFVSFAKDGLKWFFSSTWGHFVSYETLSQTSVSVRTNLFGVPKIVWGYP
jgi:hypothetical protein